VKFLISLFFILNIVNAANVEVVADKFFADEKKQISVFSGSVVVTKQSDRLKADEVTINFDAKKQPLKYIAVGNAKVDMIINEKKYFASADKMIYDPIKDQYELIGNAFLHELITDKKVYGDKIFVNQLTGRYEVDSKGSEPVKFIFKVEDKK
jgi:lipopolysaccharide export system protein LptA